MAVAVVFTVIPRQVMVTGPDLTATLRVTIHGTVGVLIVGVTSARVRLG